MVKKNVKKITGKNKVTKNKEKRDLKKYFIIGLILFLAIAIAGYFLLSNGSSKEKRELKKICVEKGLENAVVGEQHIDSYCGCFTDELFEKLTSQELKLFKAVAAGDEENLNLGLDSFQTIMKMAAKTSEIDAKCKKGFDLGVSEEISVE